MHLRAAFAAVLLATPALAQTSAPPSDLPGATAWMTGTWTSEGRSDMENGTIDHFVTRLEFQPGGNVAGHSRGEILDAQGTVTRIMESDMIGSWEVVAADATELQVRYRIQEIIDKSGTVTVAMPGDGTVLHLAVQPDGSLYNAAMEDLWTRAE